MRARVAAAPNNLQKQPLTDLYGYSAADNNVVKKNAKIQRTHLRVTFDHS